ELSGGKLSKGEAEDILATSKAERLTDAERARAYELIKEQQRNPFPDEKVRELGKGIGRNDKILSALGYARDANGNLIESGPGQPGRAKSLIKALSNDDGTISRRLFGTDDPPVDIQRLIVRYAKDPERFSEHTARELLAEHLSAKANADHA